MSELRDYQKRVIDEIYATWRLGKRALLLAMPTGSGKTRTFSELAKHFYDRHQRVLLLVHREELLWQAKNTLEKTLRSPVGIIRPLAELRLRGRNRGFSSSKSNFKVINGSNQITT